MSRRDDELAAEAMDALERELVLPAGLEERMLEAVEEVRSAREPERAAVSRLPARRSSRFAVFAAIAAALGGAAVGGVAWLGERGTTDEPTALSRDGIDAAESAARAVAAIDWSDRGAWSEKMAILERLRLAIDRVGDPAALGRVAPRYVDGVRRGFLDAGKGALERALAAGSGASALEERDYLKQYLLLADPDHLEREADWEVGHLSVTCAEAIAASRRIKVEEASRAIAPHLATLLRLVPRGLVRGIELDVALVGRTREALAHAEPRRYYDIFVTPLVEAPRDPARSAGPENLLYPPITLDRVLADRAGAASIGSRNEKSWGTSYEVLGVYTGAARRAVFRSLDEAIDQLDRDAWVAEDEGADRRARESLERVRDDYDGLYVHEWSSFLGDVEIPGPASGRALRVLAADDSPLLRVLEIVAENTAPVATRSAGAGDPVALRFAAVRAFVAPGGGAGGYRALLAGAAEDADAGRRGDRGLLEQARAFARGPADEGSDLLAAILVAPFEPGAR